jgi:predicted outer membrane repeat protein
VTLSGNFADDGGGLFAIVPATLTNSTFSGNVALKHGGGLYTAGPGQIDANNLTIAGNTADLDGNGTGNGGGLSVDGPPFNISNSIIAGNVDGSPGAESPDCGASQATSLGHNLIGDSTGCSFAASNGGPQTGDVLDPPSGVGLGPLGGNGGLTQTRALLAGSPAINAGNPAAPDGSAPEYATTDQRGTVRPQSGRCDIGAFELSPTPPTGGKKCKKKKKKKRAAAAAKKCKKKKKKQKR